MNPVVFKVIKSAVGIIGLALPYVTGYFENKALDDKIAKEVAKALAKNQK